MEEKTLVALKGSIKKWAKILNGTLRDRGAANCPLCKLFFYDYRDQEESLKECDGCPVAAKTGHRFCEGTPFSNWKLVQVKGEFNWADTPEKKHWAKEELKFLINLLPEEERKNSLVEHGVIGE